MRVRPAETIFGKRARDGAQDAARLRLRYAFEALRDALPPGGVLFSGLMRKDGHAAVLVQFVWPGVLRELNPETGELIAESVAAKMIPSRPDAAYFLAEKAGKKPLLSVKFQPPQSLRRRATIDAFGVVRVRDLKTGEELAKSMPGDPLTLFRDYTVLGPDDLKPHLT